nr:AAA-like domain-containing protein [Armatimonas sp.]
MAEQLRIKLFGTFEAHLGERALKLALRDSNRVVAYLICQGRNLPTDSVRRVFWPGPGDNGSLSQALHHLRKELDHQSERVHSSEGTVGFRLEGATVDLLEFRQACAIPIDSDEQAERATLAIKEVAVPFLDGWEEEEDWVLTERAKLKQQRAKLVWQLAQWYCNQEDLPRAIGQLQLYVELCPLKETGWQTLIQLQLRVGERSEAQQTFEDYRKALESAPTPRPSPQMEELYREALDPGGDTVPPELVARAGGALVLGSSFYIERATDAQLRQQLKQAENIIVIQGPSLSGKSSLLLRGLHCAHQSGLPTILTDFDSFSQDELESLPSFCRALIARVQRDLRQLRRVPDAATREFSWSSMGGPLPNLEDFIESRLVTPFPGRIVWAMDGLDRVFGLPYQDSFFGLLRSWYNRRSLERHWQRLTLLLVCATEPHLFIRNLNNSPFNVGERLKIQDLSRSEAQQLLERYGSGRPSGSPLTGSEDQEKFLRLVGGHPFLIGRGLDALIRGMDITSLLSLAPREDGPYGDHLRHLLTLVHQDSDILEGVRLTLAGRKCPDRVFHRLRSAGVLQGDVDEPGHFRCQLYERYFRQHL